MLTIRTVRLYLKWAIVKGHFPDITLTTLTKSVKCSFGEVVMGWSLLKPWKIAIKSVLVRGIDYIPRSFNIFVNFSSNCFSTTVYAVLLSRVALTLQ